MKTYTSYLAIFILPLMITSHASTSDGDFEVQALSRAEITGATPGSIPDFDGTSFEHVLKLFKGIADEYENAGWFLQVPAELNLVECDLPRNMLLSLTGAAEMFDDGSEPNSDSLLDLVYTDSADKHKEKQGISDTDWKIHSHFVLSNNCSRIQDGKIEQQKSDITFIRGIYESSIEVPLSNFSVPINESNMLPSDEVKGDKLIRKGMYLISQLRYGSVDREARPLTHNSFVAYSVYNRQPYEVDNIDAKQLVLMTGETQNTSLQMAYSGVHEGIYDVKLLQKRSDGSTRINSYNGERLTGVSTVNSQGKLHGKAEIYYANEPASAKCYENGQEVLLSKCD